MSIKILSYKNKAISINGKYLLVPDDNGWIQVNNLGLTKDNKCLVYNVDIYNLLTNDGFQLVTSQGDILLGRETI